METKFTKGEWKIARKTEGRAIFENPDIDVWAIGGRSIEETMANAKLIAAAPEMFGKLQELIKAISLVSTGYPPVDRELERWRNEANELITKATE